MKDSQEVVSEFNEIVNMTTSELKEWIETDDSKGAGWTGGSEGGETVGHDSATKIIKILEGNPDKAPDKYSDEDVQHMRKVVAYCKRHLAQEGHMVDEKSEDALKQSKSYKSLKNWGHDSLKVKHEKDGDEEAQPDKQKEEPKEDTEDKEEKEDDDAKTGDKRKKDEAQDEQDEEVDEAAEPEPKKAKKETPPKRKPGRPPKNANKKSK